MYIRKGNKVSLKVPGVPGTCFSDVVRCGYVNLCHFI